MPTPAATCRLPDAAQRLRTLITTRLHQPFAWGARDCFLLAADAAQAVAGHDPAAGLRGHYATARQARRLLAGLGGWAGLIAARFGPPVACLGDARDGDAVLLRAGVCNTGLVGQGAMGFAWRGLVVAQGAGGLVMRPMIDAQGVWRVVA